MDGTFSTAPRVFQQLYVIRAPLGDSAVTCVYAFLSCKTQSIYEELLQAVVDACERLSCSPDPMSIVVDFEQAVIKAIPSVLGQHVSTRACFYHLTQSTWRKVQDLGLTQDYKTNDEVKLFCGMLDCLAFLPVHRVADGMAFLKQNLPQNEGRLKDLVDYFDATYVSGTERRVQSSATQQGPVRTRTIPPLFPPAVWNVHDATIIGDARTNNLCESWNNGFQQLIGHSNPSIWTAIDGLRKDQALAATLLCQDEQGLRLRKRTQRATIDLQNRLQNICADFRDNKRDISSLLRSTGHCIRFK
jgi:hypothetical protein